MIGIVRISLAQRQLGKSVWRKLFVTHSWVPQPESTGDHARAGRSFGYLTARRLRLWFGPHLKCGQVLAPTLTPVLIFSLLELERDFVDFIFIAYLRAHG